MRHNKLSIVHRAAHPLDLDLFLASLSALVPSRVKCNHTRSFQLDYGYLVATCLTMQTIASCTGCGRFTGPYASASLENLLYYCLYSFDLVSLALGEMNGGELLPCVLRWLFADRTD